MTDSTPAERLREDIDQSLTPTQVDTLDLLIELKLARAKIREYRCALQTQESNQQWARNDWYKIIGARR